MNQVAGALAAAPKWQRDYLGAGKTTVFSAPFFLQNNCPKGIFCAAVSTPPSRNSEASEGRTSQIEKTGNVAAVQRQLGHTNAAYSIQYARITDKELGEALEDR